MRACTLQLACRWRWWVGADPTLAGAILQDAVGWEKPPIEGRSQPSEWCDSAHPAACWVVCVVPRGDLGTALGQQRVNLARHDEPRTVRLSECSFAAIKVSLSKVEKDVEDE